jgi:hypothetical protein
MMPAKPYVMVLDVCASESHEGSDHCGPQWKIQDPTLLATQDFESLQFRGASMSVMHTGVCDAALPNKTKPIAPPIGVSTWYAHCTNETWKEVVVHLDPAGVASVTGAWKFQRVVPGQQTVVINLDKDAQEAPGSATLEDKDAVKAEIKHQFERGLIKVSTDGIPQPMVDIMTSVFIHNLEMSEPGHTEYEMTPKPPNNYFWVWTWSIRGAGLGGDTDVDMQLMSTTAHAWTSSQAIPPKCLPGFATDFPAYQICDSPDHAIPAPTVAQVKKTK